MSMSDHPGGFGEDIRQQAERDAIKREYESKTNIDQIRIQELEDETEDHWQRIQQLEREIQRLRTENEELRAKLKDRN